MSTTVFTHTNRSYDVFVGTGYDNWVRIQWKDKKWISIAGNSNLLRDAVTLFNKEVKK